MNATTPARTLVSDIMCTDIAVAHPDESYETLVRRVCTATAAVLPVVDERRTVVGIVSDGDLLRRMQLPDGTDTDEHMTSARPSTADDVRARDLMTAPATTVHATTRTAAAARLMLRHHLRALPVTDTATAVLVGMLTRTTVLQAVDGPPRPPGDEQAFGLWSD